jgi:hypothetical protein
MANMNSTKNHTFLSLLALVLFSSYGLAITNGHADQASFDRAVRLFNKGFKECVLANSTRGKNLTQAKERYARYLKYKDDAVDIDRSLLTSTKRSMQKNLRYCEKVNTNLLNAEATPILEEALTHCEKAKTAINSGDLATSKRAYQRYQKGKAKALSITKTILNVFALSSQVRRCDTLDKKISTLEQKQQAQEKAVQDLKTSLNTSIAACHQGSQLIQNNALPLEQLDEAKKQLTTAQTILHTTRSQHTTENITQHAPLQQNAMACIKTLTLATQKTESQKEAIIQGIQTSIKTAKNALLTCQTAEKKVEQPNSQTTDGLKDVLALRVNARQMRITLEKSISHQQATQFPDWHISQRLSTLLQQTEQCETNVAQHYIAAQKRIMRKLSEIKKSSQHRHIKLTMKQQHN